MITHRLTHHTETVTKTYEITGAEPVVSYAGGTVLYRPTVVSVNIHNGDPYVTVRGRRVLKGGGLGANLHTLGALSFGGPRSRPEWLQAIVTEATKPRRVCTHVPEQATA